MIVMRRFAPIGIALLAGCDLSSAGIAHVDDDGGDVPVDASVDDALVLPDGGALDVAIEDSFTPVEASADAAVSAGYALAFTGTQYVQVGALPIPADFTLEAWVKPVAYAGETYVAAKDRSGQGQGQFRLGFTALGQLFFEMSDASGSDHGLYVAGYLLQSAPIVVGAWVHVAVTKSGAAFNLLVNGAVVKTITASASFAYGGPAVAFRVGGRVGTDGTSLGGGFNGTIDEVRLWSVARTAGEITTDMKKPVPPNAPQIAAYYRFDEGAGTTATDAKGGFNGTLVATPKYVVSTAF